jgi:hypothetical protein
MPRTNITAEASAKSETRSRRIGVGRLRCQGTRLAACLFLAILAPLGTLSSQTVRGELIEETLEAPIEGAFVVLLDEAGEQVAAMLTNDVGRFVLHAPGPGSYRLNAERIGYESFASPALELAVGQMLDYQMTMPVRPIQLADLSVEGERQCELRQAEGQRVASVWDEARKALTAAVWTEQELNFRFTTQLWDRLLDPRNLQILEERAEVLTGLAANPFRALTAEELADVGYARRLEGASATEYYAPDAEALLSDVFLDDHCFKIVEGKGNKTGMIGLEFEPAAESDKTEVSGVLWLSARTAHLRFVEYRYENLPADIRGSDKLGGRLEFRLLPGGAWVVDDWYIRMPITETTFERAPDSGTGGLSELRQKRKLVAIKEEGGAVLEISDFEPGGQQFGLNGRGSLGGVVIDSTRNAPLSYATVTLLGTNHRTTTDAAGRYSMRYVPAGDFFVTIAHPRVGMLRLGSALRPVRIRPDQVATVNLAIPPARRLAPALCPRQSEQRGIVVGLVTDAISGDPLQGATVHVSHDAADGRFETVTDHDGGFIICNVPLDTELSAAATVVVGEQASESPVIHFSVAADAIHEAFLEIALSAKDRRGQ